MKSITKILLLPGIGDIHWVLLKLESWLRLRGIMEKPEIWVWDFDNRPRAKDFIDRIPWLSWGGYYKKDLKGSLQQKFNELYLLGTTDEISNFEEFDYFLGVDGRLRQGHEYGQMLRCSEANHQYEMTVPEVEKTENIILFFSKHGMFATTWARYWPRSKIKVFCELLKQKYPNSRLLLTGCSWDAGVDLPVENVVGQTSFEDFLKLLLSAKMFVGWCGGNGILAQHLGCPTRMLWSREYFPTHSRDEWANPNGDYLALNVEDETPESLVAKC